MRNRSVGGQRDGIDACGLRDRELAKGQGEGPLEGGDMDDEESGGRKGIFKPKHPKKAHNGRRSITTVSSRQNWNIVF